MHVGHELSNRIVHTYINTYTYTLIHKSISGTSRTVYWKEEETSPLLYDDCMCNCILH